VVSLGIFAAGVAAGVINAVAGGGTLLTFPVLIWAGRDPIVANATNTLALWPGALAGAYALRREVAQVPRLLSWLMPAAVLGSIVGGWLLLSTPTRVFTFIVPYLVLLATVLVAAQRPLMRLLRVVEAHADAVNTASTGRAAVLFTAQLVVSVYGGYFGAGMGILMLAALGLYGLHDIHQRNGVKNLLGAATNGVAGVYFAISGMVDWRDALLLSAGAVAGGYGGASIGRRLSRRVAEGIVVAIGLSATLLLIIRARR
jgi:hypothetical protein